MKHILLLSILIFASVSLDASGAIKKATRIISVAQLKKIAPLLPDCFQEIIEIERGVVFTRIDSVIMNYEGDELDKIKKQLTSSDAKLREEADRKIRCLVFDFEKVNKRLYFCNPPLEVKIPEELKSQERKTSLYPDYHNHVWAAILEQQQKLTELLQSKDFEDNEPGKPELK